MIATRSIVLSCVLASFALPGCGDDPQRISGLVENRAPLPDVFATDTVVFDTGSPADTTAEDTTPPQDTAPPIDTSPPQDTSPADTSPPQDTSPADTSPPQDTTPADTTPPQDTSPPQDTTPADTTPPQDTGPTGPIDLNVGFIGGACDSVSDCSYNNAICMPESDGWENGMCTQSCTSTCPDRDGLAVTFCIDGDSVGESGGMCVQKCDLGKSPTGCRDGYTCVDELRYNTVTTSSWTCVPGEFEGCIQTLQRLGVDFTLPAVTNLDNVGGKICDVFEPIRVSGTIDGVEFRPSSFSNAPAPMYVQCGVALALWDMVQLAKTRGITDFVHYGTYNCRYISGTTTLSEHAFANAIDIAGIEVQGGARYTLLDHWEDGDPTPDTVGGELLFWLAHEMHARRIWNIILTPEYNAAHDNHFHLDLTPGSWFLSE